MQFSYYCGREKNFWQTIRSSSTASSCHTHLYTKAYNVPPRFANLTQHMLSRHACKWIIPSDKVAFELEWPAPYVLHTCTSSLRERYHDLWLYISSLVLAPSFKFKFALPVLCSVPCLARIINIRNQQLCTCDQDAHIHGPSFSPLSIAFSSLHLTPLPPLPPRPPASDYHCKSFP